jgi:hypothetical protein
MRKESRDGFAAVAQRWPCCWPPCRRSVQTRRCLPPLTRTGGRRFVGRMDRPLVALGRRPGRRAPISTRMAGDLGQEGPVWNDLAAFLTAFGRIANAWCRLASTCCCRSSAWRTTRWIGLCPCKGWAGGGGQQRLPDRRDVVLLDGQPLGDMRRHRVLAKAASHGCRRRTPRLAAADALGVSLPFTPGRHTLSVVQLRRAGWRLPCWRRSFEYVPVGGRTRSCRANQRTRCQWRP